MLGNKYVMYNDHKLNIQNSFYTLKVYTHLLVFISECSLLQMYSFYIKYFLKNALPCHACVNAK